MRSEGVLATVLVVRVNRLLSRMLEVQNYFKMLFMQELGVLQISWVMQTPGEGQHSL